MNTHHMFSGRNKKKNVHLIPILAGAMHVYLDMNSNIKTVPYDVHPEKIQGPVVQSIVSLTSSLVVKMLTVLVSKISYSQVFLLKKM